MIPYDRLLRRSLHKPLQQMLDMLLQHLVDSKPDGIANVTGNNDYNLKVCDGNALNVVLFFSKYISTISPAGVRKTETT